MSLETIALSFLSVFGIYGVYCMIGEILTIYRRITKKAGVDDADDNDKSNICSGVCTGCNYKNNCSSPDENKENENNIKKDT